MRGIICMFSGLLAGLLVSCGQHEVRISSQIGAASPLAAEYSGLVVPCNISPVNFFLPDTAASQALVLSHGADEISVIARENAAIAPLDEWRKLLQKSLGDSVSVTHCIKDGDSWKAYDRFSIYVSEDSIDSHLVYRLIAPGYEKWNRMGIYERNLENFDERAIVENDRTDNNCMNCHSFCMQDAGKMMFHVRAQHGGTILYDGKAARKLATKTDRTISNMTYPYWHPSGRFIACSVNDIHQVFHTRNTNRIEVFDVESDVVVYDIGRNRIFSSPLLFSKDSYETFPSFSPDGRKLIFSSARAEKMPDGYDKVRYDLCSVDFDPETMAFSEHADTLFSASRMGKSASFARMSPKGRYVLFTLASYGNFSIWHQDADLWMIDTKTGEAFPEEEANSSLCESYHSWSSNGRWVVFSSRRRDGLYTRPYISHVGDDGRMSKPFILPQKSGGFYDRLMFSFNIPELVQGEVPASSASLYDCILDDRTEQVEADENFLH